MGRVRRQGPAETVGKDRNEDTLYLTRQSYANVVHSTERAPMTTRILRLASVIDITGLSRSAIYLRISKGTFPKQVSLGARAIGWRKEDIQEWLDNLAEKS
jgi:prophage regulatory protein